MSHPRRPALEWVAPLPPHRTQAARRLAAKPSVAGDAADMLSGEQLPRIC
jgi:hypothetical protein